MIQEEREWSKICELGTLQLFSGVCVCVCVSTAPQVSPGPVVFWCVCVCVCVCVSAAPQVSPGILVP